MLFLHTVPGFEPMTFGTLVSSHNHWTKAPVSDTFPYNKVSILRPEYSRMRCWTDSDVTVALHFEHSKFESYFSGSLQSIKFLSFRSLKRQQMTH